MQTATIFLLAAAACVVLATDTKRAFLGDFLEPHGATDANGYFTLLTDCWSRRQLKHLRARHGHVFLSRAADDRADRFDNYDIIDFSCPQSYDALAARRQRPGAAAGYSERLLILVDADDLARLVRLLMKPNGRIEVSIMSRVIIAKRIESRYELDMVYRISSTEGSLIYEPYGNWNPHDGLHIVRQKSEITSRRRNLQGLFFAVSVTVSEDMENEDEWRTFRNPQVNAVTKSCYAFFQCAHDMINITSRNVYHNSYVNYNASSQTPSGQLDHLRLNLTNFSASPLVMAKNRIADIDFLIQISQRLTLLFIFKRPPISYVKDIFTIAFTTKVWYALVVTFFLYTLAICYLLHVERKLFENETVYPADGALITLESVSQQGSIVVTKSNSGELLVFFLSLACLFLYTSYSSKIVVLLQNTVDINTPGKILASPLEVGSYDSAYSRHYMKSETEPIKKAIYETKVTETGFVTVKDGLERVRRGGYAFHVNKNPAYYYILKHYDVAETCGLQRVEATYLPTHLMYLPLKKASPYKKIIKVSYFRIFETGLHMRHILTMDREPKCAGIAPPVKIIELVDVQSGFVLFLSGILLALAVFGAELALQRKRQLIKRRAPREPPLTRSLQND